MSVFGGQSEKHANLSNKATKHIEPMSRIVSRHFSNRPIFRILFVKERQFRLSDAMASN